MWQDLCENTIISLTFKGNIPIIYLGYNALFVRLKI